MNLFIDNKSGVPIYEQIYSVMKEQIMTGELRAHEALPSIRGLAKDLQISFITTKRAYDALENDGFIYTVPTKGCYVSPKNMELLKETNRKKIKDCIHEMVQLARGCEMPKEELQELIDSGMEEMK